MRTATGLVLVLTALALLGPTPVNAADPTDGHGIAGPVYEQVQIVGQESGLALDVAAKSARPGAPVIINDPRSSDSAYWSVLESYSNDLLVRNEATGLFLAVSGGSKRNGALIVQWENEGQRDILWQLLPAGGGRDCFRLRNAATGQFVAVAGGAYSKGNDVIQWPDQGQPDIAWCLR